MKKTITIVLSLLLSNLTLTYCQNTAFKKNDTTTNDKWWYVLIKSNTQPLVLAREFIRGSNDLESQVLLSKEKAGEKKFGEKHVVVATLKAGIRYSELSNAYGKFNIAQSNWNQPLLIDGKKYEYSFKSVYVVLSSIKFIGVVFEEKSKTNFISIVTDKLSPKK